MTTKPIRKEMNHTQVIEDIATATGQTKQAVKATLNAYKSIVLRHLQKRAAGQFKMLGLVKLEKAQRKARQGRNPATGEAIRIPAKRTVRAKPLAGLKNIDQ